MKIPGIHHVTAIATEPQVNLDFYTDVLGLRLVKRTVNFDDPGTYHLYFGDEMGRPGTLLTFFPWPRSRRGTRGVGQVTMTSFSVPAGSLGFWRDRLGARGIEVEVSDPRLDEEALTLLDPDGLSLELVEDVEAAELSAWSGGPVPEAAAIRGLHGVTLSLEDCERTASLLTETMSFRPAGEAGNRLRFTATGPGPGVRVDLLCSPGAPPGLVAAGTVHHVAFRVAGDEDQQACRERLVAGGTSVTPVRDRNYFRSIYFREPGGVLFEIATDPPGFTVDEPVEALGAGLKLPGWLEPRRDRIEAALPRLAIRR